MIFGVACTVVHLHENSRKKRHIAGEAAPPRPRRHHHKPTGDSLSYSSSSYTDTPPQKRYLFYCHDSSTPGPP